MANTKSGSLPQSKEDAIEFVTFVWRVVESREFGDGPQLSAMSNVLHALIDNEITKDEAVERAVEIMDQPSDYC